MRDAPTGDGVGGNDEGTGGSRTAPTGDGGRGWVPAYARTTEGDGGGRPRGTPLREVGEGDGSPHTRGQRRGTGEGAHEGRPYGRWGKGMGPRIREDNGGGRAVREPPLRGMGSVEEGEGGKGSGFVVIEGTRWYSALLKGKQDVRLSYTHFPQ